MSRSEGKPPTVADSTMLDDRPQAQPKRQLDDLPTASRDRYDIAGEHARGGLGVILRARDQHLERTVAIKEIGANADERASTRFVREALITARLQHPGIVPVYEAGRWPNGARFYAMKMVSGRTLREELKARGDLEGRLAVVPNVLAVAEAVGYAHAEGVIHRDLKPDNVMIGAFGETVVVDWGLAKDRRLGGETAQPGLYAQAHAEATRIGAVLGTPAYMSPEQARGEDVDERADVWALGAILYHLLAAEAPYQGAPDSVIQRVANEPAPRLADKAPGAPRDLVAIVDKAMARDLEARYANAKELAGDLSRFLTGQLVGAREYNQLARVEHWVKQHRAPVIVAAILLAILAVTASVSIARILGERRVAQNRSDELLLTQARSQLDRDPTAALAWIKQYPASGNEQEAARNIVADAISRGVARHVWRGNPEFVVETALSPDGHVAAAASRDVLQLWSVETGALLARFVGPAAVEIRFSPDGTLLATGADDGSIQLVDIAAARVRPLGKINSSITALEFTTDGRAVVSGDEQGGVFVWPVDGSRNRELLHRTDSVWRLRTTADSVLAVGGKEASLVRIPLGGGTPVTLAGPLESDNSVVAIAIGPRGNVVFGRDDRVMQWEPGAAAATEIAHHHARVGIVAMSSTGRVASGSDDGVVIETVPGEEPRTLGAHANRITALVFDPSGAVLASGDASGNVRRWTSVGDQELRGHDEKISSLAVRADGAVISASHDRTVRAWAPLPPTPVFRVSTNDLFRVAFVSPTTVVTTGRDHMVHSVTTTGVDHKLAEQAAAAYDLEVLPSGAVASASWDGSIVVVGLDGVTQHVLRHGAQKIWNIAASPDGKQLASAGADGAIKLWDLTGGTGRVLDQRGGEADDVVFSPDGNTIVTSGDDFELRVFDLRHPVPPRVFRATGEPLSLTFAADGTTVYSAGGDGVVQGWSLATGASQMFTGHDGQVRTIALSPDQRYLASGGVDGRVIVWDLRDGETLVLPGHTAEVRHVAFSPDSRRIASAGWDGTVRVWDLDDHAVRICRGHQGKVHRVAFSPDGTLVASAGEDGTVRFWSVTDQTAIALEPSARGSSARAATTAVIDEQNLVTSP